MDRQDHLERSQGKLDLRIFSARRAEGYFSSFCLRFCGVSGRKNTLSHTFFFHSRKLRERGGILVLIFFSLNKRASVRVIESFR